ncbi:hypothetical protein [uncultured Prevotella sp.]|nr:hypothetical protein [uncultured Prevotella sp.]
MAIRQQYYRNSFATLWQTTSSRRGRFIVSAYNEYTHEMGDGNAYVVM